MQSFHLLLPSNCWKLFRRFKLKLSIGIPYKYNLKWRQNWKFWIWGKFCHRNISLKIFKCTLGCSIFPLQIISDTLPLSLTLPAINACFIHCPSNVKNYSISHKSETGQPPPKKKTKKYSSGLQNFTLSCQFVAQNSKYKWPKIFTKLFWHLENYQVISQ